MRRLLIGLAFGIAAVFSNGAIAQQGGHFRYPEIQFEKGGELADMKVGYPRSASNECA